MPAGVDYETMVGLWLNRDRQMVRRAMETTIGIGIAFGGQVPDSVWQALTSTEYEAQLAKWNHGAR